MAESSTRTLRTRRIAALLAWGALAFTAIWLWNARQRGSMTVAAEPVVAFILSAFSAFVAVFAWMLFNPTRRSAVESPTLSLAAAATLFPPPIIGFCLLASDSPLRAWLALGLFILCVVAILSHVPDDFFGVPRDRYSYLVPIPAFDGVRDDPMDPNADWFRVTNLSAVVADTERPSLAPKSYLQRESAFTRGPEAEVAPRSDVDDILGSEFDVSLLDDPYWESDENTIHSGEKTSSDKQRNTEADPGSPSTGRQPTRKSSESASRRARLHAEESTQDRLGATARTVAPDVSFVLKPDAAASMPDTTQNPLDSDSVWWADTEEEFPTRGTADETVAEERREFRDHSEKTQTHPRSGGTNAAGITSRDSAEARNPVDVGQQRQSQEEHQLIDAERQRRSESQRRELRNQREAELREQTDHTPNESDRRLSLQQRRPSDREHQTDYTQKSKHDQQPRHYGDPAARKPTESSRTAGIAQAPETDQTTGQTTEAESIRAAQSTSRAGTRLQPEVQRTKDANGDELVEGVLKVRFEKGQKRANLHVPFSPPLAGVPEVECECVDGEQLRLKVPVRQSWGIRIEARRSNADHPLESEVGFAALSSPN